MSLSNRRQILLALAALPLAACGFTPVYQQGTAAAGLRNSVLVDEPADRAAFDPTRAVEDRLGRPETPAFGLSVSQSESQSALAVQGTAAITRYNLIGSANYTLRDLTSGLPVASGTGPAEFVCD